MSVERERTPSRGGSPRSNPSQPRSPRGSALGLSPAKPEIPTMWEPVFPDAERLIDLVDEPGSPELRYKMEAYNKRALSPKSRGIDGWRGHTDSEYKDRMDLISDILSRWWYVFPMWPPRSFDYTKALRKIGYREVQIDDWLASPDIDQEGLRKCYQLGQFRGVFRNASQEMLDMRPKSTCPCFANLSRQTMERLTAFVIRAYENQIEVLKKVQGYKYQSLIEELDVKKRTYEKNRIALINKYDKGARPTFDEEIKKLRRL